MPHQYVKHDVIESDKESKRIVHESRVKANVVDGVFYKI